MKRLILTIASCVAAALAYGQTDIKVEVHNVVAADEHFNVTFIVEGESSPTDFEWNPGNDFQLLWGPQQGHSTSIQVINGKRTRSEQTTFTYVLKPVKEGKFTLPKATAKVKGKEISSKDVEVQVVGSSSSSQRQG